MDLRENQDRIAEDVWITRANAGHLFNAYQQDGPDDFSPERTLWAFGSTQDQGSFEDYRPLKEVVVDAVGGFNNITGHVLSLWLIDHDEYYDVHFDSWQNGQNGKWIRLH